MSEILLPWVQETLQVLFNALPSKKNLKRRELSLEIAALQSAVEILQAAGEAKLAIEVSAQLDQLRNSINVSSATMPLDRALLGNEKSLEEFVIALQNRQTISDPFTTIASVINGADPTGSFKNNSRSQDPMSSALILILFRNAYVME